jgi:tRNA(fMet)-specific endonuclease VapC
VTTPRYMLDTNMCVYLRRRRPVQVVHRFASLEPGEAVISAITHGELRYGAEKHVDRERLLEGVMRLVELLPVEAVPALAGAVYGQIRAGLERRGEIIGNHDLWIAAHALAAGLTLVTNNEREFRRVPELKVENWAAA